MSYLCIKLNNMDDLEKQRLYDELEEFKVELNSSVEKAEYFKKLDILVELCAIPHINFKFREAVERKLGKLLEL